MATPSTDLPSFLVERQQLLTAALDRIAPRCQRPPCDVHRSMRYTLLGPSKRVRGVMALLVADLFQAARDPVPAAAAIELVHASSLILDDLPSMDDTDTRRGGPSNHVEFGEATSILAAVALLTLAFGHVASAYDAPLAAALVRVLSEAVGSEGLIGGQAADLQLPAHPLHVSEIEPVDERKTAVLFRAAAAAGAMVGGAAEADVLRLAEYGDRVGLAFQIIDDILDTDERAAHGREGSAARPAADVKPRRRDDGTGDILHGERRGHAPSLADLSEARQRAEELSQSAVAALEPFGVGADRLRELARFVVDRTE